MKRFLLLLALLAASGSFAQAQILLREDTASQAVSIGPFLDPADGTAEGGLTIDAADVRLKVNGGADAAKNSGGCTHDINGMYDCTFDATDTATVGRLNVSICEAGAVCVRQNFQVVEEAIFDACCVAAATGAVTVASGGIAAAAFAAGAIDASAIAADAIGASEIAANALTTAEIATGAISADEVADDAIDAGAIAANALTTAEIATGAISSDEVADNAIDAGAIATDAITAAKIASAAIAADEIATDAIGSAEIATGAIDAAATAADFSTEVQDADVESVNGATLTGDGTSGDKFRAQ
jgi:hypothetical protein